MEEKDVTYVDMIAILKKLMGDNKGLDNPYFIDDNYPEFAHFLSSFASKSDKENLFVKAIIEHNSVVFVNDLGEELKFIVSPDKGKIEFEYQRKDYSQDKSVYLEKYKDYKEESKVNTVVGEININEINISVDRYSQIGEFVANDDEVYPCIGNSTTSCIKELYDKNGIMINCAEAQGHKTEKKYDRSAKSGIGNDFIREFKNKISGHRINFSSDEFDNGQVITWNRRYFDLVETQVTRYEKGKQVKKDEGILPVNLEHADISASSISMLGTGVVIEPMSLEECSSKIDSMEFLSDRKKAGLKKYIEGRDKFYYKNPLVEESSKQM